ncbi:Flagellar biosynthesis/type III secretory pathway chaperone [Allopseudospirillum japonicum]|uniref:Flagellar biosynthesis/type III secretory pathway chaperone n=1 Tax=Allopseudospirillum japonicum TaxID=64971 RepID=A0A1H6RG83_9GAMM|nr:flagellar protein FlgN [Allopseudospirillum japonicum]SEI54743.1 Flagellar biosynthesis/type III secretory pathway chaperone [Allopseudospirillum japonicum]
MNQVQDFKNLLLQSIKHLQVLKTCLEEEERLLSQRDLEALEACTQRKQAALQQVHTDIDTRRDFLQAQGQEASEAGVQAWLADQDPKLAQALGKGWAQLVKLLSQVHQHNKQNGILVMRAQQQVGVLLNLVKNSQGGTPSSGKVYSAKGASRDVNNGRTLGSA